MPQKDWQMQDQQTGVSSLETVDFGWGNPYFLLEILNGMYTQKLSPHDIENMSYAPDRGIEKLIDLTRQTIEQTTGIKYRHIIITNGATHALNTILRFNKKHYDTICTLPLGYPYYPDMIQRAGYQHVYLEVFKPLLPVLGRAFSLIDSPSNPLGIQTPQEAGDEESTVWDAVYHNRIYTEDLKTYPKHKIMVGSYSKLLGLTGARVGWIATNHIFTAKLLEDWALKDNATVSVPSQNLIVDILEKTDLDTLTSRAKRYLDLNREEFQKIEYLFDGQSVPKVGMFYCVKIDQKIFNILHKCGINYVKLEDNYIRLSLGQTHKVVKEGIRRILKEDRIK